MDSLLLSINSSREQLDGLMINSNGLQSSTIVPIRLILSMNSLLREMELWNPLISVDNKLLMRLKLLDKDLLMLSTLRLAILMLSLHQRLLLSLLSSRLSLPALPPKALRSMLSMLLMLTLSLLQRTQQLMM